MTLRNWLVVPAKRGISVNPTNALPCFGFIGCDCGHLGRAAWIWSHHFWSMWVIVALGSDIQSHQVQVLPGRPVASSSGISQE
jgi:hypothetical protein